MQLQYLFNYFIVTFIKKFKYVEDLETFSQMVQISTKYLGTDWHLQGKCDRKAFPVRMIMDTSWCPGKIVNEEYDMLLRNEGRKIFLKRS